MWRRRSRQKTEVDTSLLTTDYFFMFGISQRTIKDFDWWLPALALAVAIFGVIEISSAETARPFLAGSWRNQLWGIAAGLVVMLLTMAYDYRVIVGASYYFYAGGLVLLILVLTPLGDVVN